MAKLTISIVNFNAGSYIIDCLKSLDKVKSEVDFITYVVDNASTDDSLKKIKQEKFPIKIIQNSENLGFGKAHNLVLKQLSTPLCLLLNPDCVLEPGTLATMIKFMDGNPKVGAATCQMLQGDRKVDLVAHRGFPTPFASFLYFLGNDSLYHLTNKDLHSVHEVDAISGAFFLTRKEVLDKVGYFDEDYFMYAEDIDLCFRIKQGGFKIMYVPTVSVLHHKGISSGLKKHTQEKTTADLSTKLRSLNAFYETMKIFYKKHYESKYPFFVNWLIYLGINTKWQLAKRKLTV